MSKIIGTIHGSDIVEEDDLSVTFSAGATLDGDGANGQFGGDPCYAPSSYSGGTLDVIGNAGHTGNWFGVVTDNGENDGTPIVQGISDPCPGAYVSATSLHLPGADGKPLPRSSPFKYVDSATVPFIAVPPMIIKGVAGIKLKQSWPTAVRRIISGRSAWLVQKRSEFRRAGPIPPIAVGLTRRTFTISSFPESRPW